MSRDMKDGETGVGVGVICNCMYDNEEENGMIDNVEGVRVLY